jgi:tRNA modification GTPase
MLDVDTIVSLSTAPGVGAIAIVRVSGPDATRVLQGIVGPDVALPAPRVPSLMELLDPEEGSQLDRAVVTRLASPASYTGEDMLELSCHGGWLIPQLVVDACVRAGARLAEPGEFTKRAYLRGKLDLTQAEAIADLIEARSRALHRAALGQLERGLSKRVAALRERLVGVEALLAHHIDFPEEDDAPVPLERVVDEAEVLVQDLDAMLATAPEGELLREGALTVFAGRPNAGKSSLYNALIGEDRAIVTDEPGTTRDALEATVQLGGFPFRLVDTAGLRPTTGQVERLGVEIAQRYVGKADVLLFCVSAEEGLTDADRIFLETERDVPVVLVETKDDLVESGAIDAEDASGLELAAHLRVSIETGRGLDQLHEVLPELVYSRVIAAGAESPVVMRQRHARALTVARNEIADFRTGLLEGLPAEVAATHLRPAETALEEILGVVSVDDVLDVVFRDFCVGK